jgi:DNA processing protein
MPNSTELTPLNTLAAWLQLEYTPKLPLDAIRAWLNAFGSPEAVVQASVLDLASVAGESVAMAFKLPIEAVAIQRQGYVDAALAWLADSRHQGARHILTWDNINYPAQLLTINDPPLVLFVQGNTQALNQPAVGIVGARHATQQGVANARSFAHALAEKNITVISGLALGIDAAAHEGALLAVNNPCSTVAVIGTGIDRVYPSAHRDLAHRIAAQGAVISEFPVGTPPIAHNFPRRNRLIAGLSRGILVVEAAIRSGSLITARVAGEQGREVLAIPGSIHAPLSKGCHQLIKQGAKLVESAQDILEELHLTMSDTLDKPQSNSYEQILQKQLLQAQLQKTPKRKLPLSTAPSNLQLQALSIKTIEFPATNDVVLAAMGHTPMDLDQIVLATALSTSEVLSRLTELELLGDLEALDGGRYQRLINH